MFQLKLNIILISFLHLTFANASTGNSSIATTSKKLDYVLTQVFELTKKIENNKNTIEETIKLPDIQLTFIDLYQTGIRSYLANDWSSCIDELEAAMQGYHDYYVAIASCRNKCEYKRKQIRPMFPDDINDLHYYERIIRKTLCMEKCKRFLMPDLKEYFFMDNWSKRIFQSRKPYEYLQLCYFRVCT